MQQKVPILKRRAKSFIDDYQKNKEKLPFIKPRYIKEDMFSRNHPNIKHTNRTNSTNKYEGNVRRNMYELEFGEKESSQRTGMHGESHQKMRFKLQDFYRNMAERKIRLESVEPEEKEEKQSPERVENEQGKIHFAFLKRRSKKYRVTTQKKQEIQSQLSEETINKDKVLYSPIIITRGFTHLQHLTDDNKVGRIKRQSIKTIPIMKTESIEVKMQRKEQAKKKFRKVGNAILFMVFLQRYSRKFRARRKRYIEKTGPQNIKEKFMELKLFFSQKCQSIVEALSLKHEQLYQITEKDSQSTKAHKISSLRKLTNLLLDCLSKGVEQLRAKKASLQVIYSICKHGSFSCQWDFHTPEQLDLSCISSEVGYICADNHLESSAIIGLVFVKIVVYGLLLHPETASFSLSPLIQRTRVHFNMKLLGNIFYELLISLQDKYLEMADSRFNVGNWRGLAMKFSIKTAQSMTVRRGFSQKNELISGLYGHTYVRQTYKVEQMNPEVFRLQQIVLRLHLLLKDYHMQIRTGCM